MKKQNEFSFIICLIVCILCMILAGYFSLVSAASRDETCPIATLLMGGCMVSLAVAIKTPTQKGNGKLQAFFKPTVVLAIGFFLLAIIDTIAHEPASEIISWVIVIISGATAITLHICAKKEMK